MARRFELSDFRSWTRRCADVLEVLGEPGFGPAMTALLGTLVPADSALILAYPSARRPEVIFDAFDHPQRQNNIETYLQSAYLLDPFYLWAQRQKHPGVLRMREIAPEGFTESDYFLSYYKRSSIEDEVNLVCPADRELALVICYERAHGSEPFSDFELELLVAVCPEIAGLLRLHWRLTDRAPGDKQQDVAHNRLMAKLDNLGAGLLTSRERDVVQLILRGHSNHAIADQLSLSQETVKVHRRNIYAKLKISSLSELFSLAMRLIA